MSTRDGDTTRGTCPRFDRHAGPALIWGERRRYGTRVHRPQGVPGPAAARDVLLEVRHLEGARLRNRQDLPARTTTSPITPRRLGSVEVDQWFWSLFPGSLRPARPVGRAALREERPGRLRLHGQGPERADPDPLLRQADAAERRFRRTSRIRTSSTATCSAGSSTPSPRSSPKLGPVMFQFEYLNKQKMPSKEVFFEQLRGVHRPGAQGLSVRGRDPQSQLLLARRSSISSRTAGWASSISTATTCRRSARSSRSIAPETASFQVVRLHGGDRLEIEGETGEVWNRIVAPKPGGLKAAAKIVRANAKKRVLTYLNLNNHYEGSAPLSIAPLPRRPGGQEDRRGARSSYLRPASSILAVVSPPLMR
ncbi:MAG: DUF72 domain-containing protein [Candidatus Moduliflexus flocculans]|nr:DUF72 domain-containing protein [Candidatus Moduliflexus flocculans]